jgi:hypothetical protein
MSVAEKAVASTRPTTMAETMTEAEIARAEAIMKGWFAFNDYALMLEHSCEEHVAAIGRKAADMIAKEVGQERDLIDGRDAEFGRILANTIRTFQMTLPYHHQGNDALMKEQLKWMDYAQQLNRTAEMVQFDIDSMKEIFEERRYWIEQTGDISLALDAVTTPTCFRDLTVADGISFNEDRTEISYLSPYKRILEKGWLRNIWTGLTEENIHNNWTIPRFAGYQHHFQVRFEVDPWNEETRMVKIRVHPKD